MILTSLNFVTTEKYSSHEKDYKMSIAGTNPNHIHEIPF